VGGDVVAVTTTGRPIALRTGTVAAYTTGTDVALVRQARAAVGRVTLSGRSGLRAIQTLKRQNDLWGVDLDPASYLDREPEPDALFPFDWIAIQRELNLPVVRSVGLHARRGDEASLRGAFAGRLDDGTVRTVSLDGSWLQTKRLPSLLAAIRNCDDPLAFVLAAPFDPLDPLGAVDGLVALTEASSGRYAELLRTDTSGIAFAAAGGALGAIGLSTTTRHHGLPMGPRATSDFEQRQRSPLCFVAKLNSWQHGAALGALAPFGGAGITSCDCAACDGRDLLRFDQAWPGDVPSDVRADARAHDFHTWLDISRQILAADDPMSAWRANCRRAVTTAATIADTYKVALRIPGSITSWA